MSQLRIDVLFSDAGGDIDVELYDDQYVLAVDGKSVDDDETVIQPNPLAGIYYVEVYNMNTTTNSYDLGWSEGGLTKPAVVDDDDDDNNGCMFVGKQANAMLFFLFVGAVLILRLRKNRKLYECA